MALRIGTMSLFTARPGVCGCMRAEVKPKRGQTYFYRIASLYIIWRQVRVTLALTYVLPEDTNLSIVQRLLEAECGTWAFVRELCIWTKNSVKAPSSANLTRQDLPAIIACPFGRTGRNPCLMHRSQSLLHPVHIYRWHIRPSSTVSEPCSR